MIKTVTRNIPVKREDRNDRFRVQYNDRSTFDRLEVIVKRTATGDSQTFYFSSSNLPLYDSIHFTTGIIKGELIVTFEEVQPELPALPIIIELEQSWFKMGYYVYVVAITHERKKYFYVGMTGDRKHITARSPFYRMAGHFNQIESSTENQIIRGLREKVCIKNLSQNIGDLNITYYSYLIEPFVENCPNHHSKRIRTEMVESSLISMLRKQFSESVLNKNLSRAKYENGVMMANKIYTDLKNRKIFKIVSS